MTTKLADHVLAMFAEAERQGLFIGLGRDPKLPNEKQEGKMVKELRRLALADSGPLRNDWLESFRKGITLCEKNGDKGDADTLRDIVTHLGGKL